MASDFGDRRFGAELPWTMPVTCLVGGTALTLAGIVRGRVSGRLMMAIGGTLIGYGLFGFNSDLTHPLHRTAQRPQDDRIPDVDRLARLGPVQQTQQESASPA